VGSTEANSAKDSLSILSLSFSKYFFNCFLIVMCS